MATTGLGIVNEGVDMNQERAGIIPSVVDTSSGQPRGMDIYSALLQQRIVSVEGPIGDQMAGPIVAQLLWLDAQDSTKPIFMYINSPGGVVTAGLAIYDAMQHVKAPVYTICAGQAASMGSVLLMAGEPGHRYSLPNSTIMIHQLLGGAQGQATDVMIRAAYMAKLKDRMNDLYEKHTGVPKAELERLMERDNFLFPEDAIKLKLIDGIIQPGDEKLRALQTAVGKVAMANANVKPEGPKGPV